MQGMILIVKMYCDQGIIHNVFMQEVNNNFHNGLSSIEAMHKIRIDNNL